MASRPEGFRRTLPALGAAVPITIIFIAVLSIVLTAAGTQGLRLSAAQTSSWIVVIYGLPAIPSVVLAFRYRQPMLLTGNVFAIIFFASLGGQFSFAELSGASLLAGAIVVVAAAFGLTRHLAAWIPAPIVQGLIAGAVMPFVVGIFSGLSTVDERGVAVAARVPAMVGAAFLAYLLSRRFVDSRLPPIFPALVAGLAVAGLTGQLGPVPTSFVLPDLTITRPAFSLPALASATPVLVALITLQSNLPSVIYMRSQGFRPPERVIDVVSGVGTMAGSFLGPNAMSLALPLVPLAAGPGAGDPSVRYRSIYVAAGALLLIALLAGTAAELAVLVPPLSFSRWPGWPWSECWPRLCRGSSADRCCWGRCSRSRLRSRRCPSWGWVRSSGRWCWASVCRCCSNGTSGTGCGPLWSAPARRGPTNRGTLVPEPTHPDGTAPLGLWMIRPLTCRGHPEAVEGAASCARALSPYLSPYRPCSIGPMAPMLPIASHGGTYGTEYRASGMRYQIHPVSTRPRFHGRWSVPPLG